ncbi:hypothetical protein [Microvirga sp. CF3016]|uniref:hypothetical protein n=1 Tax=Microvirga sp. CF3016 TaxID=3110181 RepID=UPI002E75A15C|nr:hypothetical protein [Microvirga sp. CF3016]MEE1613430.1 hypothetical protein [Microvirga sp. CF3016]
MSVPCKFERSLLSHEEYETIHVTHHPAIHGVGRDGLHDMKDRLRQMRDRERTLARQKRREVRGKVDPRGGSFPGTAERPLQRKQVFAGALKRVNREIGRLRKLEARAALTESARRALALRRAGEARHHPPAGDTARLGMHPAPNERADTRIQPGTVGSVSQATKTAQAIRDSKA